MRALIKLLLFKFLFDFMLMNYIICKFLSCTAALLENGNNNYGKFQIQPIIGGNSAEIDCSSFNSSHGQLFLDNNFENFLTVSHVNYEYDRSFRREIIYERFNSEELTALLATTVTCHQGMYLESQGVSPSASSFAFRDGFTINTNEVSNEACNCFVDGVCKENLNKFSNCRNTGENYRVFIDSGNFP